jgi:acyl-homoserine lactone acylase PvdQ
VTYRRRLHGDSTVEIARDAHGVPHVAASTEADLYRGLGHCHATDRALQMLLLRILGRGRAAEVLDGGDAMVRLDRFSAASTSARAQRRSTRSCPRRPAGSSMPTAPA